MGIQALASNRLIEIDTDNYQTEIALKNMLLGEDQRYHFQAAADTDEIQWEVLELLLTSLAQAYPQHFILVVDGENWRWRNHLLNYEATFRFGAGASLPLAPLDWLGRQVQEDLLIMSGATAGGMPLVAGQLCFPSDWCLDDKMGKSFLAIHDEVPLFAEHLSKSSNLLLERLKAGRAVWRLNWGIKTTARLNLTPRFPQEAGQSRPSLTPANIGQCCFLRVERQVLTRLPRTNGILFTIHTYLAPLATIASNTEYARRLLGVLRTMPAELHTYKGTYRYLDALLDYLEAQS